MIAVICVNAFLPLSYNKPTIYITLLSSHNDNTFLHPLGAFGSSVCVCVLPIGRVCVCPECFPYRTIDPLMGFDHLS